MSKEIDENRPLLRAEVEAERKAYAGGSFPIIDASLDTTKALDCLRASGVESIIRYYCRDRTQSWKIIGRPEAQTIIAHGLSLCAVYEVTSAPGYFSRASGLLDADYACNYGRQVIGQPSGSIIYFAVDFDASPSVIASRIIPYFMAVRERVQAAGSPYRVGVYGSGRTCRILLDQGFADLAWLAQSTGWAEYQLFKAGRRWALLQKPTVVTCKIEVDFDEASVDDFGAFATLNDVATESQASDAEWDLSAYRKALDGLVPDLKARAELLVQTCAAQKIRMVPQNGLRSAQEQARLWRQSRTPAQIAAGIKQLRDRAAPWLASVLENATGPQGDHVTNSLPGLSWHQWGEALDCYREIDGTPNWDDKNYEQYADIAETAAIGLTAGGHWKKFKDWPHVQLRSAAGPQNIYTYSEIDAKMKAAWATEADEVTPSAPTEVRNAGQGLAAAHALQSLVDTLQSAREGDSEQKPYFFPNGIFKIDVSLGVLADAPSADAAGDAAPLLQAKISISGIDKEG